MSIQRISSGQLIHFQLEIYHVSTKSDLKLVEWH